MPARQALQRSRAVNGNGADFYTRQMELLESRLKSTESKLATLESMWQRVVNDNSPSHRALSDLAAAVEQVSPANNTSSSFLRNPTMQQRPEDSKDESPGMDFDIVSIEEQIAEDDMDAMGSVGSVKDNLGRFGYSSTLGLVVVFLKAVVKNRNPNTALSRQGLGVLGSELHSDYFPSNTPLTVTALPSPAPDVAVIIPPSEICAIPPRHRVLALLDSYFTIGHTLYPYLHRRSITEAYMKAAHNGFKGVRPTWLALLNMIFAIALQTAQANTSSVDQSESAAFYQRAKRLSAHSLLSNNSIEGMQLMLLMCLYLQSSRRPNQCWNTLGIAIRIGQALGLHKQQTVVSVSPLEREIQKRTWNATIVLDVALAMTYGRPLAISSTSYTSDLPSEESYDYFEEGPQQQVPSDVTPISFFVHTIRLYQIMGRAVETLLGSNNMDVLTFEALETPECFSQLGLLEKQLTAWFRNLPPHLKSPVLFNPSSLQDRIFARQATILSLRYHHCDTLIHRPYFIAELQRIEAISFDNEPQWTGLREGMGRATANASIAACINSARRVLDIITDALKLHGRLGAWWYTLYYAFQAALLLLASGLITYRSDMTFVERTIQGEMAAHGVYLNKAVDIFKAFADNSNAQRHLAFLKKLMHLSNVRLEADGVYFEFAASGQNGIQPSTFVTGDDFDTQNIDNVFLQDMLQIGLMDTNERGSLTFLLDNLPPM